MQQKITYNQYQSSLVIGKQLSSSDSLITSDQLVPRLKEILSSIVHQKESLLNRFQKERNLFEEQLINKERTITQLRLQNATLKEQIANIQEQLTEKKSNLQLTKRQSQLMQKQMNSMHSVMTYLQQKNKQLSYEIYQMKKLNSLKNPRDSVGKKIAKMQPNKTYLPKYLFHNLDQQSIFQYTGILDHDMSINQLHRTESSPNLQCFATATQVDSSILPKNASILLKETSIVPKEAFPVKKEDISQRNFNLQKVRSFGQLFDVQSTKNSQQITNSKRISVSKIAKANITIKERKKTQIKEKVDKILGNCGFKSEVNLTKRGK